MTEMRELTRNAEADDLAEEDYREIYQELRQFDAETGRFAVSLDKFIAMVGSADSKATWNKYDSGERGLSRSRKNELRRAVGKALLPPTVLDVVAEHVDGDAQVVKAGGEALAGRVILLATVEPVTIHANGSISILDTEARRDGGTEKSGLAPAPSASAPFGGEGGMQSVPHGTARKARAQVSFAPEAFEPLNRVRVAAGWSWDRLAREVSAFLQSHAGG